jgi:hypothetical protein
MSERGRQPGFRMSDEHRVKIQNSNILNALIEHVVGEREMSATQVSAGLGLLRKIMPDLAASTITADVTHEVGASVTDLMKAIDGRTRSK